MKRISMELGGKSPFILLKGADYEKAIRQCFNSIFLNSGQTCTALSRLIIPREEKGKIEQLMLKILPEYTVGDPSLETTKIGPVVSYDQWQTVDTYIAKGMEEGATLLAGSRPEAPEKGYYVKPVIFTDVTNDMTIAREEIFGPVLCVITYDTVEEALAIANDTPYGSMRPSGARIKPKLPKWQRLSCRAMSTSTTARDVTAPFGGFKDSGIGREGGKDGMLEFTEPQAIFNA